MNYNNRNYNSEFIDTMDEINNRGRGKGFKNGIDWAATAQRQGELAYHTYQQYSNCHDLRVRFSHGNAKDICVSRQTLDTARKYLSAINRSHISRERKHGSVKIPYGGFRAPYIKEFNWQGSDGNTYHFKFEVVNERNYIDNGSGGTYADGYFIHIIKAPYYSFALNHLHEFHIIRGAYENHICWNRPIRSFQEANAVMFVWVKRYVAVLIEMNKNRNISEESLMKRVNKKASLPAGTFRSHSYKYKHKKRAPKKRTLYITKSAYERIMHSLGTAKPELGGMLGWTQDQMTITDFVFDESAATTEVDYIPNIDFLNGVLHNDWNKNDIYLGGFVHSHPGNFNILSQADISYARRIAQAFELPYFVMPVVTSSHDYKMGIYPYVVHQNGRIELCRLQIVPSEQEQEKIPSELLESIEAEFDAMSQTQAPKPQCTEQTEQAQKQDEAPKANEQKAESEAPKQGTEQEAKEQDTAPEAQGLEQNEAFARISGVIDIPYMKDCTVIGIGCGGARGFYEDMARIGVGSFYLIDGDISSRSNIASQNGYISEIGKPKPEVVKARLLDINDEIKAHAINRMLNEQMTDEWLYENIFKGKDPKKLLICAFTDSFLAQARATELALKYGIPYIAAQHHANADTSELIYWYPGISRYTPKEILRDRYAAYENGYKNTVTSVGSPIFNTTRLNAICSKIAAGMLMYGADRMSVYSSFLRLKAENNLLIIRQKHLVFTDAALKDLFDETDTGHFDDILWMNPQDLL